MILYNFCNETLYITAAYNSENTIIAIPILSTHCLSGKIRFINWLMQNVVS